MFKHLIFVISLLLLTSNAYAVSTATCTDTDTKLLLHMNGTDASTTFTDSSSTGRTMTANGNAQIDTAQSKFGGASGLFDGSGDYVSAADSTDWDAGTGDFTVEAWVRHNSQVNGRYFWDSQGDRLSLRFVSGNFDVYINGSVVISTSFSFSNNTWNHLALTRSGTNLRLFVDGTQQGSTTTNSSDIQGSGLYAIGSANNGSNAHDGWIDEFRYIKGTAIWTANFTPPSAEYSDTCVFRRRLSSMVAS